MNRFRLSLLCAVAFALCTGTASAADYAANLSGSYANISNGGGDLYSVNGAVKAGFGGGWGGEIAAGWHHATVGSGGDLGNAGGSIYWGDSDLRVAANVNYLDLSLFHLAIYGASGEWYAASNVTVSLRGGGASGQFGIDGGYVGGDAKWYITPDLALNGGVDYINLSGFTHVTSEDIRAEWLISETTPVSLFAGYAHAETGLGDKDVFFVGVKIYTNDGAATLIDRQRGGNLGYIAGVPYFGQEL